MLSALERSLACISFLVVPISLGAALGEPAIVRFTAQADTVPLVAARAAAPLVVDAEDWPGVRRAAADLQLDVERVTGCRPVLGGEMPTGPVVVIIGTLGRSRFVDALARAGRIDTRPVRGAWESWITQVVADPFPGVGRALVIAGSDKRGSIYGIYEVCEQIGVSPWHWWADVAPDRREEIHVLARTVIHGPPSVKYRGIFLNDEAPSLTNWVKAKFGYAPQREDPPVPAGVANYGREFHARLFEVLLRLRANCLWPAMWNNAFNEDDPENARLADEYGIVMGTSHQEPMLRAQKEWDRRHYRTIGSWNYAREPQLLQDFWRGGVRRNRAFESIYTLGLRGANDTPMAPGGPEANRALLEEIVEVQRRMLMEEVDADVTRIPQVWCLYKEVQDFYAHGMRVPEDVTLLWAEDNWGNVRRLPTAAERVRPGGAGIYYHFDYHGAPRSYQWANTNPIPKIWEQMSLAAQYGADRIWIVNAGHFKGYEVPVEFFMRLAWDTRRWTGQDLPEFTRLWAAREFGEAHAGEIAALIDGYTRINGRRKPEMLGPATYSLAHYREWERVVAEYAELARAAEAIQPRLAPDKHDAYHQLVLFPVRAGALLYELYQAAALNQAHVRQGRASARASAAAVRAAFQRYEDMVAYYHRDLAGGKWNHILDQPVLGYISWNDPPVNSLRHLSLAEPAVQAGAEMGVVTEGDEGVLRFDSVGRQKRYVEVFNRGVVPFNYQAGSEAAWLTISPGQGTIREDQRLWVEVDWRDLPPGEMKTEIVFQGGGREVRVPVVAVVRPAVVDGTRDCFVESDGCVAIEAEHYAALVGGVDRTWARIAGYGRTLSGMRAESIVDAPPAETGRDSPRLEYRMHLFSTGTAEIDIVTSPTLNFMPGRPLRCAVSIDDAPPQVITLVPADFSAGHENRAWSRMVAENANHARSTHTIAEPGLHTLRVWMIDPGVVVQRIVVDLGGVRPSYLGPPESLRLQP